MTEKCFVDTNIFVYARDSGSLKKQEIAEKVIKSLWKNGLGRISTQVLNELYTVLVSKYGVSEEVVSSDIKALFSWQPCSIDISLLEQAFVVRKHYKLSWWDCLIIAAALMQDCKKIISEDLSEGANYLGLVVENPFSAVR